MKKFSMKKNLGLTLLNLKPGVRLEIKNREFKVSAVRKAVCRINGDKSQGVKLACSEVGSLEGIFVWREG
jgi:hypothetical protein